MNTTEGEYMTTVLEELSLRGFIENQTHEAELEDYIAKENATCYIGFDPTANSLHVGNLVPIMSLAHMQRYGHRPIALVGGGTGLIGDPSGKTEMRRMLTLEQIEENAQGIRGQLARFLDFSAGKAILLNNADWLTKLSYIPLLRDIGTHFSVNRMLKAESYRMRLESEEGLSFIEFNYQILQAYDFLVLFDEQNCRIQMGGSDQWGNIVAGVDLVRRMRRETVFGITFPLITTAGGIKMGKTHEGAIWLDPGRTSPYDYYQYWVNTDDRDVVKFLKLYTFLPLAEIEEVNNLKDYELNAAKTILAFEATTLAHGRSEAENAYSSARSMFGGKDVPESLIPSSAVPRGKGKADDAGVPTTQIDGNLLEEGIPAFKVFVMAGLASSGAEARRLISQGGGYINGNRIDDANRMITKEDMEESALMLRAGKKKYHRMELGAPGQ